MTIITTTSGTTGALKEVLISEEAIQARCEAWKGEYADKRVACSAEIETSIYQISFVEAVKRDGGQVLPWDQAHTAHIVFSGMAPAFKLLKKHAGEMRGTLQRIVLYKNLWPHAKNGIQALIDVPVHDHYGITEVGRVAFDGIPARGIEWEIRAGVLWVRSKGLASGYRLNDGTEQPLQLDENGWYDTRDEVTLENGRLSIIGRV
jgi:hypothetical protein